MFSKISHIKDDGERDEKGERQEKDFRIFVLRNEDIT